MLSPNVGNPIVNWPTLLICRVVVDECLSESWQRCLGPPASHHDELLYGIQVSSMSALLVAAVQQFPYY